jgi:hypothetical protein
MILFDSFQGRDQSRRQILMNGFSNKGRFCFHGKEGQNYSGEWGATKLHENRTAVVGNETTALSKYGEHQLSFSSYRSAL